ncbi:hypothetical protein LR48_Vigan10g081200 [Vigna angularis]|uniref:Uncharacterized protein n=1 Tax=Phaseolus angularis TaxID=3914 RepID=A0A0L9VIM8_PHAAN|nr:hypothetical protein LR48_Vigan10g081200 [Vigna angularis]
MNVNYNDVIEYEVDISGTVHTQIEESSVSGESRGRSSSIVLEFRHRQIEGFTLHSVGECQLNYASAKTTNSSIVILIRMSRVEYGVEEIPLEQELEENDEEIPLEQELEENDVVAQSA